MKQATGFTRKHRELWKMIKFLFAAVSSTVVELVLYYVLQNIVLRDMNTVPFRFLFFEYEGLGYLWAFLISTTVGYAIAFVLNRKVTFHADADVRRSVLLYTLMVVFTIFATTWLGVVITNAFIGSGMRSMGEIITKPIVACSAILWTYPINRFVIHRKKKPAMPKEAG